MCIYKVIFKIGVLFFIDGLNIIVWGCLNNRKLYLRLLGILILYWNIVVLLYKGVVFYIRNVDMMSLNIGWVIKNWILYNEGILY